MVARTRPGGGRLLGELYALNEDVPAETGGVRGELSDTMAAGGLLLTAAGIAGGAFSALMLRVASTQLSYAGHDSCGTLPGTRITTLVLTLQVLVERQMTGSRTPRQR